MSEPGTPPTEPQCPCGTTRASPFCVPVCDYTIWGAFYLSIGGTPIPKRVSFRCVKCRTVFDTTTDPTVRYRNR